ncbi:MAG: LamB/YcsF family protein, partial [Paeniglutamicibacter terrestris]
MTYIDLNSDVGESFGNWTMGDDAAIFASVSSANVACGFHAGDPSVIAQTCRDAVGSNVTIGAHVGYRDLAGFGRRFLDCSATELADDVLYQLGALEALARAAGSTIKYVKPHG